MDIRANIQETQGSKLADLLYNSSVNWHVLWVGFLYVMLVYTQSFSLLSFDSQTTKLALLRNQCQSWFLKTIFRILILEINVIFF